MDLTKGSGLSGVVLQFWGYVNAIHSMEADRDPERMCEASEDEDRRYVARCRELGRKLGQEAFFLDPLSWSPVAEIATPNTHDTFLAAAVEEFAYATTIVTRSAMELCALDSALSRLEAAVTDVAAASNEGLDAVELDRHMTLAGYELWDRVEIATVRTCGAWDRAAQVLSCVFFNIREFDRDTFPATIERLKVNFARADNIFSEHDAWRALQRYLDDPSDRGYRDLAGRRNIVTHSIGLSRSGAGDGTAGSERPRNALDTKRALRLKQSTPAKDVRRVLVQVRELLVLRQSVIDLCHFGIDTYGLRPVRF